MMGIPKSEKGKTHQNFFRSTQRKRNPVKTDQEKAHGPTKEKPQHVGYLMIFR